MNMKSYRLPPLSKKYASNFIHRMIDQENAYREAYSNSKDHSIENLVLNTIDINQISLCQRPTSVKL